MKHLKLVATAMLALVITTGCGGTATDESIDDTGKLEAAHTAVKEAYGDMYLPNMPIDPQMVQDLYGVDSANVKNMIAEAPMVSMNPDLFIGIEAVEGKAEEVATALETFAENDITQGMHYPANLGKVKATQVITIRDHVFLVRLGANNENMDATEAESEEFAKTENQKAVDAINEVFGVE